MFQKKGIEKITGRRLDEMVLAARKS